MTALYVRFWQCQFLNFEKALEKSTLSELHA